MRKRLGQDAWRTAHQPKDYLIEKAWLDEHHLYGGLIHERAADALTAELKTASARNIGHTIYFKLFAEYANALEVAGAWGWAIRTRREPGILLDRFLTYPFSAPGQFYIRWTRDRVPASLVRSRLRLAPDVDANPQDHPAVGSPLAKLSSHRP